MKPQIDKEILELIEQQPDITNKEIARILSLPEHIIKDMLEKISDTRQKILIVDDELDALIALKRALEADNYNVIEASDGLNAIEKVKAENPDIILLDLMMPEIDGIEVCKRLKSNSKYEHIPIIMLTAKGDITDKIEGIEIGADDYVTKPFNLNELKARIKMVLRRGDT